MKALIITMMMLLMASVAYPDSETLHSSADISATTPTGTPVKLSGEIIQFLGGQHYLLRDRYGKVVISLPGRLTADHTLPNGSRLTISGKVTVLDGQPGVRATRLHSLRSAVNPATSTLSY